MQTTLTPRTHTNNRNFRNTFHTKTTTHQLITNFKTKHHDPDLDLDLAHDPDLDPDHDPDLDLAPDLDPDHDHDLVLDPDPAPDPDHDPDLDPDLDHDLARSKPILKIA